MYLLKKISLTLSLFIFATVILSAQPGMKGPNRGMMPPPEKAKNLTEKMKTALDLTKDQYTKVMKINLDFFNTQEAIQQAIRTAKEKNEDIGNAKKEMKKNRAEHMKQLKMVLTGEQWKTFKEKKNEFKEIGKDAD